MIFAATVILSTPSGQEEFGAAHWTEGENTTVWFSFTGMSNADPDNDRSVT